MAISSCQDAGQEDLLAQELLELNQKKELSEYESKLKELSLFMGEVFKDREARKELFELAKADEYIDDIDYSLKALLQTNENPVSKKRSAIAQAFYSHLENFRVLEMDLDKHDLINFINSHNITILAPYLVGYFNPEQLTELTVSWWTEEMEIKGYANDPDWKGETPGYRIKLDEEDRIILFPKDSSDHRNPELVMTNDDYAMTNPTIVIGEFLEIDDSNKSHNSNYLTERISSIGNLPHLIGVNCTNVLPTDVVRWTMPEFRITGNTRGWPHPNRITMWVVSATNPGTNPFINEKKIKRGDFDWKSDFIPNNGTLVSGWESINLNQQMIIGVKRPSNRIRSTVVVSTVNSNGIISNSSTINIEKNMTYLVTSQSWLRCSELNGNYMANNGNGFRGPLAIWAYGVNRREFEVQFTLAPQIIRN